ncbi:MAG: hypothetical protein JXQ25_07210 [Deltaproteobacteria bacterium]|nr:hypothetical protein [Deltaproteobacteria bacterium]
MGDLKKPWQMYLKAILFLLIALFAAAIIVARDPAWETCLLLVLLAWSSARAYYFAFYVIENYIDEDYKFSGLTSLISYLISQKNRGGADKEK